MGKPSKKKAQRRKAKAQKAKRAELTAKHQENRAISLRDQGKVLPNLDVTLVDEHFLDAEGRLLIKPAADYALVDHTGLRVWCHQRAFYGLPTTELIDWLLEYIGDRFAIEVGSGNGIFGRTLDIPRTDSLIQNQPDVALQYMLTGQPRIPYPDDVEQLDAVEAVRKYDPQVVIGSWVTHWIDPNLPYPLGGGSMYGIKEDEILDHPSVEAYVVIGNSDTHGTKPILSRPHRIIQAPWLWSRAAQPENNCIMVWETP